MQSIHVDYNETTEAVTRIETASPEPWEAVCQRFDNDVHRIMGVNDQAGYTALYVCYDENNLPVYYLVEENETLAKLRRRTHLSKLGHSPP